MPTNSPVVDARSEWFSMIMSYLQMKTFALWLSLHPESNFEQFESVWPALLDQMMQRATAAAVDELQKLCQITFN